MINKTWGECSNNIGKFGELCEKKKKMDSTIKMTKKINNKIHTFIQRFLYLIVKS